MTNQSALCQRSRPFLFFLGFLLVNFLLPVTSSKAKEKPHIIVILADDLGWNDVGFHNRDILTPHLDELAAKGIILNQSYVEPVCTASRSALMTSYYPFRLGLQHAVILPEHVSCLPLDKTILPRVLKDNGYNTHMIGKWHLGFCDWRCTPTRRGFDSFYGYYGPDQTYYGKRSFGGFDFREDEQVKWEAAGTYSTYQYADRAKKLIHGCNDSKPMFLYYSLQSVHDPLEAPDHYLNMYQHLKNRGRRTVSAMVTAMDDAVGEMVQALKAKGMYDNSVILFTSDNGGMVMTAGNNLPLRGSKVTLWEGGTRAAAFISSPLFANTGTVYNGMIHAVDWFPTLLSAANIRYHDDHWDGVDQWSAITNLHPSKRSEFVYGLDNHLTPIHGRAAIRVGDFKLIEGFPGIANDWYKIMDEPSEEIPVIDYSQPFQKVFAQHSAYLTFSGLYNLKDDPEERTNLYHVMPDTVTRLKARLNHYWRKMVPYQFGDPEPASHPGNFGGVWSPGWCRLDKPLGQGQCPQRTSTWAGTKDELLGVCTMPG